LSARHQDWALKIDYNNGSGTGDILWRMGLDGDFTFINTTNDPWPWFSYQHDVGIEDNGTGVMSILDNGDVRVAALGSPGCEPTDCNSRGMALKIDETPGSMQVTPVLSANLGYYSTADGSAQLLPDGNYFFLASVVVAGNNLDSYSLEILPTAGTDIGTTVLNLQSQQGYRAWQMTSLYNPPTT
jgi:arylsulfate sulfotransferase